MLFHIKFGDTEKNVRVESRRNRLYVKFDGEEEERIDIAFYGNDCSFIHNCKVFSANVVGKKNEYTVWHPENSLNFQVENEYKRVVGKMRGQDLEKENRVTAKMPGKIVKIFVKKGAQVAKGDPLAVMEAMKMENEIRASIDGKILEIAVKEGQAVEHGDLLVEMEPNEK